MAYTPTTLLSLPVIDTGTESGSWGNVTNNGLTQYLDIAIAGALVISTDADVTLANTAGTDTLTNISTTTAQYATIRWTASGTVTRVITAPSSSRSYRVINATGSTQSITIKASGQTGVTFLAGTTGVVAFNGTDYVLIGMVGPATATDNAVARFDNSGRILQNSAVTIADTTGDITGGKYNGLTITTSTGTLTIANGKTLTLSNTLTFTGTDASSVAFGTGGTVLYNGGALGTPSSGTLTNCTGLPISTGVTGLGTNVATALGNNVGASGAFVVNGGVLGTPSSGTLTNATGLPISTGVSGLGTNVATALGTAVGSAGAFVVNGGALGTPSSGTATNLTGLPLSTGVTGTLALGNGGTGQTTQTAAFNALSPLTTKGDIIVSNGTNNIRLAVGTNDYVLTADSTAAGGVAWKVGGGGTSVTIANDTTTASDIYPLFSSTTSGTASTIYTGNANLLYKPSTGELKAQVPVALNGLIVNSQTVAANYTVAAGYNALSAGPVSVNSGITVTVSSGSVWTVV